MIRRTKQKKSKKRTNPVHSNISIDGEEVLIDAAVGTLGLFPGDTVAFKSPTLKKHAKGGVVTIQGLIYDKVTTEYVGVACRAVEYIPADQKKNDKIIILPLKELFTYKGRMKEFTFINRTNIYKMHEIRQIDLIK